MPSLMRSIIDSESNKRREGLTWFPADRWFSKLHPGLCLAYFFACLVCHRFSEKTRLYGPQEPSRLCERPSPLEE